MVRKHSAFARCCVEAVRSEQPGALLDPHERRLHGALLLEQFHDFQQLAGRTPSEVAFKSAPLGTAQTLEELLGMGRAESAALARAGAVMVEPD